MSLQEVQIRKIFNIFSILIFNELCLGHAGTLVKYLACIVSLKVHKCRFENFPICLCSRKNNTLKILHS